MVLSRGGFEWLRRAPDGYDLWRIIHVLGRVAVGTFVLAAAAGVTTLLVDRPVTLDRLLHLIAVGALASAVSATVVWARVVGQRRRKQRETVVADVYRRIDDAQNSSDQ
jgi:hypothetical protein